MSTKVIYRMFIELKGCYLMKRRPPKDNVRNVASIHTNWRGVTPDMEAANLLALLSYRAKINRNLLIPHRACTLIQDTPVRLGQVIKELRSALYLPEPVITATLCHMM